jgi:hypothetical protein
MEWPLPAAALRGEERRRDGGRWWPLCFRFPCFCARRLWHATRCQAGDEEPTGADCYYTSRGCLRLLFFFEARLLAFAGSLELKRVSRRRGVGVAGRRTRGRPGAVGALAPAGGPWMGLSHAAGLRVFSSGVQRRPGRAALAVVVRTCGEMTNNNISKSATATNSYGRARPCRRVGLCVGEK